MVKKRTFYRRKKGKPVTAKTVNRMIVRAKESRKWSVVHIATPLATNEYHFVRTLTPDYDETGKSTIKSIDLAFMNPTDGFYRLVIWQQNSPLNRNINTTNTVTARGYLNNIIDLDITATASAQTATDDILTPWDPYSGGGNAKILYDKIILQDANGNGAPHIQRVHISGKKLKPFLASPNSVNGTVVGSVLIGVIMSGGTSFNMQSRCQYNL